jgi:TonB family protein
MHNVISVLGTMVLLVLTMVTPGKSAENPTRVPLQLAQSSTPQTTTSNAKQRPPEDNTDFGPYIAGVKRRVKMFWAAPSVAGANTVLKFTINSKGEVLNVQVARSSGDPKVDEAATQAIFAASPFAPLPQGYKGNRIEINFTFDINQLREAGGTPN